MKLTTLSLLAAGMLLITLLAFVSKTSNFESARSVIVMRKVANDVLKYTGDSTSAILPVKQLSEESFQIPFASSFSFKPDSLVSIIKKIIAANHLPPNYIVNVVDIATDKPVFGFAMLGSERDSIMACLGRDQPVKKYRIDILFQQDSFDPSKGLYGAGFGLMVVGLIVFGRQYVKRKKISPQQMQEDKLSPVEPVEVLSIAIGEYRFQPSEQQLVFNDEKIELTIKESKLLHIFAVQPNQIVDRRRLQKEVWEDEGVIVGRSLDMFISKLRKKLEKDPLVKLTNIHGKGYRLDTGKAAV